MFDTTGASIRRWFETLERCVQTVDYDAARAIFAADTVGFGTRVGLAIGRETLAEQQWSGIWPNIREFHFNLDDLRWGSEGELAWGVCTWESIGFDRDGQPYDRPGRATVILVRRSGAWLAMHTHFSLVPGTPPRTYGPAGEP